MKPIKFEECNVTYAEDQPEYLPLPVYRKENREGEVVSCWKLTLIERIKVLFTGKLYFSTWTFGNPLQPQQPSVHKKVLIP